MGALSFKLTSFASVLEIENWNLDQLASTEAANAIGSSAKVIRPKYEIFGEVFDLMDKERMFGFYEGDKIDKIVGAKLKESPSGNFDTYLVLVPYSRDQYVRGLGAWHEQSLILKNPSETHATYEAVLIDASTGGVIASRVAEMEEPGRPGHHQPPSVNQDQGDWADTVNSMSDAQKQKLHEVLTSLIKASVPYTLRKLGFASADDVAVQK